MNYGQPKGFLTSILIEGNQRASLPLNLGRLIGFSILILNCDDQGTSLPRSEWKVTSELGTTERFLYLNLELFVTKELFYLDLSGW